MTFAAFPLAGANTDNVQNADLLSEFLADEKLD
jgi:hypothetical protein